VAPEMLGDQGVPVFGTGMLDIGGIPPRTVEWLGPDRWMVFDVHGNR